MKRPRALIDEITEQDRERCLAEAERCKATRWGRIVRWIRWRILRQDYCPRCQHYVHWKFELWNPIHEDGPPMFAHCWCSRCGLSSGIQPTSILEEAIRKHAQL